MPAKVKKYRWIRSSNFAVPKGKGKHRDQYNYPINTKARARNALARVSQFGTPEEKRLVRRAVARKWGLGPMAKKGK